MGYFSLNVGAIAQRALYQRSHPACFRHQAGGALTPPLHGEHGSVAVRGEIVAAARPSHG